MRARIAAVAPLLAVAALLWPDAASPAEPPPEPAAAHTAPAPEPAPPPPPDHCADYEAMQRGQGHPVNQEWFNHLDARGYARVTLACVYGGGTDQWECLDQLWHEESGWNHTIRHGIAQRMPETTAIREMGPDYRQWPRRQVDNGLAYIYGKYGAVTNASMHRPKTPCRAGY